MKKEETKLFREAWIHYVYHLQDTICKALEAIDGKATFIEDAWQRAEGRGGGGLTKVISNGNIFEKGGVNVSVVYGHVTDNMRKHLNMDGDTWFACGLSLVIHPINPFVPTVHANWRYFELHDADGNVKDRWFGGGSDLTPYYLFEEDATHFHTTLKKQCDAYDTAFYPLYKKECDHYFMNRHRNNECRGIGGIFYDYLRPIEGRDADYWKQFSMSISSAFLEGYLPIVEKRKNFLYTLENKYWQEIRRGRYVEFNLIHDRGTLFGLKTNGRTESILMSLPPTVRFEYNYRPEPGSEEEKLTKVLLEPKDWA